MVQDTWEERRAAQRAQYAREIAPSAEPLIAEFRSQKKAIGSGCLLAWVSIAIAGTFLYSSWKAGTWREPSSLALGAVVIAVAFGSMVRFQKQGTRRILRNDEIEGRLIREVLPAVFASLRTGAKYNPKGGIDRRWHRLPVVSGIDEDEGAHQLVWSSDGIRKQMALVRATREMAGHGLAGDRTVDTVTIFWGQVAIAERPAAARGFLRVTTDLHYPAPSASQDLQPIDLPPGLASGFKVEATSPGLARELLGPHVVERLNAALDQGHRFRVVFGGRDVVVAFDHEKPWFHRPGQEFGEARYVMMGEMLDLIDALAAPR